jgi:hypothetical protein
MVYVMCRATHLPTATPLGGTMGRSLRLLAVLALAIGVALASATGVAAAVQPTPPTIQDQNDRRTASPLVEEAWHNREAVELFRSGERNFVPDPDLIGDRAARPSPRPVPVRPAPVPAPIVPRPGVGVVASLLLSLVGGVIGGCAALAGWTATTRRRPRQPASAT